VTVALYSACIQYIVCPPVNHRRSGFSNRCHLHLQRSAAPCHVCTISAIFL